ncbi:AMP-binding protein [Hoeflea sp. WL0058]|uniref:AMP-binding protein n=1 Tax=Flavimaribacter sediminis TaxID=2865987 RepID=A0AAE3CZ62_9HYPH|nr:AMP-binding protein [Flavimaribacter sediminis]MBW8636995.1 AMP-binding protein [Flavimaribacter sediminis]
MTKMLPDSMDSSVEAQTIDTWITGHAEFAPNKAALIFNGQETTYSELREKIANQAEYLSGDLGLKRGDRIAWYGKNSDEQIILLFAAARLGLMLVPLNWRLAADELNYVLSDAGVRVLFHDTTFESELPRVTRELDDIVKARVCLNGGTASTQQAEPGRITDPLLLVYTSGTTGRPKGAVITQQAVFWNALSSRHAFRMSDTDVTLNILPMFHVGGLNIQTLPTFLAGGTVVLHAQFDPNAFYAPELFDTVTLVTVVPTILRALTSHPDWEEFNPSRLKCMAIGSTDVPVSLIEEVHAKSIPVVQIYGATETGPVSIYQTIDEAFHTVGSIGRRGLHSSIRIVDAEGQDAPDGTPGEVWVKAPNCFSGYWNNPAATRDNTKDGWFRTGDVAVRDSNGLYWFRDRLKNVLISGGENIYPAEIERVLSELPGIGECCVVGRPDEKWGQAPVAVVTRADDTLTAETVHSALKERIARFKQPKEILFVDALPKNAMGKVVVDEVRRLVQTAAS